MLRRPRVTLLAVTLAAGAALAASLATPDRFRTAGYTTPSSESARSLAVLDRTLGYDPRAGMVILARSPTGFARPGEQAAVRQLAAEVARDPAVGAVQTAFGAPRAPELLSRDGHQALLLVHFRSSDEDAVAAPARRLRRRVRAPGLTLRFGGYDLIFLDANAAARSDLVRAELIAFPLLGVLMLVIFRRVVAAALPLLIGATSVVVTFACLRLLGAVLSISVFALDLALLLGLGLAVDYALFLVSRYREEARRRGLGAEAVQATVATAGRAVTLSGLALAGASASLLLFPQQFIYSMGIAGIVVSLLSVGAALLIAPALMVLCGGRLVASQQRGPVRVGFRGASDRHTEPSRWHRWAHWVARRPLDASVVGTLLLVAAAAPALRLTPTFADQNAVPPSYQSRQVADAIDRGFTPHLLYPVNVALVPGARLPVGLLALSLERTPGVARVAPLQTARGRVVGAQLVLAQGPYSDRSQALVRGLRAARAPVLVGGNTAEFLDLKRSISSRAGPAIAAALLATFVVLLWLTRSLVLAIKSQLIDALGLAAALGLLVLIFQHHALGIAGLLGYRGPPAIETSAAVVLVASTFGLTTDYSILLLSRIVEEHEAGLEDREAVARGIARTGPVISSSALLLAVALLAMASSRVFLVKELTVGQVLGVGIDVTCVRMLLVPSLMRIFGRANWWGPGGRGVAARGRF